MKTVNPGLCSAIKSLLSLLFAAGFLVSRLQAFFDSRMVRRDRDETKGFIMSRLSIAKLGFVIAAGASFLFSVSLWFSGSREEGLFVGLWVPSILSFGTLILGRQSNAR